MKLVALFLAVDVVTVELRSEGSLCEIKTVNPHLGSAEPEHCWISSPV